MPEYDYMGHIKEQTDETPYFLQNKEADVNNIKKTLADKLNELHEQFEKLSAEIKIPEGYGIQEDKKLTDLGGQIAIYMCMPKSLVNEVMKEEERRSRARVLEGETTVSIDGVECGTASSVHFVDIAESKKDFDVELLDSLKNGSVFEGRVNGKVRRNEEKLPRKLRRGW